MGTSNFHNKNASKVFAILPGDDDDEFYINDEIECVTDALRSKYGDQRNTYISDGKLISTINETKRYQEFDVTIIVDMILRHGYYEGANLDWDVEVEINHWRVYWDSDTLLEDIQHCVDTKRNTKNALKWIQKTVAKLTEEIEKEYATYTTPLNVVGRFSNGETIYEKS